MHFHYCVFIHTNVVSMMAGLQKQLEIYAHLLDIKKVQLSCFKVTVIRYMYIKADTIQ